MSWSSIASAAIPALVGAGTAIYGANANKQAAGQVADAYGRAAQQTGDSNAAALDFLREGRDLSRGDLDPYRTGGAQDYGAYRDAVGTSFQASPGYEFAREEGIRGLDQAASARGMLGSGGRLRELMRYGTGVASQEYGNWLSRLQGLAGAGQAAAGSSASLAQGAGAQMAGAQQSGNATLAGLVTGQGQANAAGTVGTANALLGGVNQGVGLWSLMNRT